MFWKIFYNFILLPVIIIIGLIFSVFNKKIRLGLLGRFQSYKKIKEFINDIGPNKNIFWFDVA